MWVLSNLNRTNNQKRKKERNSKWEKTVDRKRKGRENKKSEPLLTKVPF
jgi:hypothetical protein